MQARSVNKCTCTPSVRVRFGAVRRCGVRTRAYLNIVCTLWCARACDSRSARLCNSAAPALFYGFVRACMRAPVNTDNTALRLRCCNRKTISHNTPNALRYTEPIESFICGPSVCQYWVAARVLAVRPSRAISQQHTAGARLLRTRVIATVLRALALALAVECKAHASAARSRYRAG